MNVYFKKSIAVMKIAVMKIFEDKWFFMGQVEL